MATRIAFSTHWPDRMGDLAGKPTYFQEKIWSGLRYQNPKEKSVLYNYYRSESRKLSGQDWPDEYGCFLLWQYPPKTTTIRSNYEYWKSKEGQLLQPFFWAGKPRRSKHVVFCPEVRLVSVLRINLDLYEKNIIITAEEANDLYKKSFISLLNGKSVSDFTKDEGFDHPDHFWAWFERDFSGAYLELESVKGCQ